MARAFSEADKSPERSDDSDVGESAISPCVVKPSDSPKLLRKRLSRSGSRQLKISSEKQRRSSVGSESGNRNGDDDDPEYSALVRRLQKRIKDKRVHAEHDKEKRAQVESSRPMSPPQLSANETRSKAIRRDEQVRSNEPQVSLVDMFAVSKKDSAHPVEEVDIPPPCPKPDVRSNDVIENDVVDASETGASSVQDEEDDKSTHVRLRKRSSLEEREKDAKRDPLPSTTSQRDNETASLLRPRPDQPAQTGSNEEIAPQRSFWRRCLGIFSCFVLLCGVWKCVSK